MSVIDEDKSLDSIGEKIDRLKQEIIERQDREKDSLVAQTLEYHKCDPLELVICTGPHPTRLGVTRTWIERRG